MAFTQVFKANASGAVKGITDLNKAVNQTEKEFKQTRLASEVDGRDFWAVLVDVFDFMQAVDDALAEGETVAQGLRHFAWWLGMAADFGAGLRQLQTN